MKQRIDRLVVDRKLAVSTEKAQAMIMAGVVLVNDVPVTKAGTLVDELSEIRLKGDPHPYVGRGGLKLEGAVRGFGVAVEKMVCLDIGSSTGGFTDFMLKAGASRVYAVDVDIQQLDWKLQTDARVKAIELNARFLRMENIGELVDLVTMDASFISLTMLLPVIPQVMKPGGVCLALVKPQFEVGKGRVGNGGIVRDEALQNEAVLKIAAAGREVGLECGGVKESSITGRAGNREFFIMFTKRPDAV